MTYFEVYLSVFLVSLLSQLLVLKLLHNAGYFMDKKDDDKPQRLHTNDVRRIGGIIFSINM
jgi:UDP-N-acetylmuramyl pentapeptide phosphotransferase/UDP-N-acetylglucosamine-1-phosphate transferase